MVKKIIVSFVLFVILVAQFGCGGPLAKLDDLLPYVPSVIDFAVNSGRISSDLGVKLKDDIASGNQAVVEAKTCLSSNQKSDAACYIELADKWRAILGRNHVAQANDPKISIVFGLISEIVDLVVRKNTQPAGARGGVENFDKLISAKIDQLEREVKH